jgi:hypothetical protein
MKHYEYLCDEDAFCILALLKAIKASGKVTHIKYEDPECEYDPITFTVDQIDEFMDNADGGLEEFDIGLYNRDCAGNEKYLGGFYIVPDGDYTTICDYVANDLCESIAAVADAEIDMEEKRTRYMR